MKNLSTAQELTIRIVGPLYSFLFHTTRRRLLGFTVGGWLKFLPLALLFWSWLQRWPIFWVPVWLALAVVVRILYWRARRDGYIRFIPEPGQSAPIQALPIVDEQKVSVRATGVFSVKDHEAYILQKPAEYWRVNVGDHAVMVQHSPGRYMYQFIQPGALQQVQSGYLVFGPQPQNTLAITFLTTWGPKFADSDVSLYVPSKNSNPSELRRTIFLSFDSDEEKESVWHNLLRDAKQPIDRKL